MEKVDALLRSHKLSVTSARKAVLWAVTAYPHSDADTLWKHARKKSGSLSKQSVYDNLCVLNEKGIVRTIRPMGHPSRFEIEHRDNHHHLVCRACGATIDIHCKKGAAPCLAPNETMGFVVDEAEVVFWGLCPVCKARKPKKGDKAP